jgi:anti-sigma factor RsiW
MNETLCERLDDYLAHDLMGADRGAFAAHLDQCAECRAAVRAAERLAGQLRTACKQFDATPPDLAVSITGRIDAMHWRRRALAAIALAASIGFVAFWLSHDGSTPDTTPKTISPPIASAAPPVRVTFPGHKTIAVPVESESPNVTVLLVYPNLRTQPPENHERNER